MDLKVYIIYDNRHSNKHDLFAQELERQKIDYEIFPAIVLTHSVVESISESFKSVIRKAKEQDLEMVCIMEDDVCFTSERSWEYFLENVPKDFDIYIGGSYLSDLSFEYKAPLIKVDSYIGNHCIIVHKKYYDTWLDLDSRLHCDTANENKGDFYLCFPMIAQQRSGLWSVNNHAPQDYNKVIDKKLWL